MKSSSQTKLLAIETSCDETAAAVIDLSASLATGAQLSQFLLSDIVSSQIKLHQQYGGVVPELAAREHLTNLPLVVEEALSVSGVSLADLSAIAVTAGPGLKGCLLVGMTYGRGLAFGLNVPMLQINHLEGHLWSGLLAAADERPKLPALVLLVSGGHSELVVVKGFREYEVVARTQDDAVGEAFDKCATLLKLPYPGGPALSRLAEAGDSAKYSLPIGMPHDPQAFSFSGVKTAVQRLVKGLGDSMTDEVLRADIAASIEGILVEALAVKTERALARYRPQSLVLCGGVAANQRLRGRCAKLAERFGVRCLAPNHRWCSDNAAMIGVVGALEIASQTSVQSLPLTVRPRWSIDEL